MYQALYLSPVLFHHWLSTSSFFQELPCNFVAGSPPGRLHSLQIELSSVRRFLYNAIIADGSFPDTSLLPKAGVVVSFHDL